MVNLDDPYILTTETHHDLKKVSDDKYFLKDLNQISFALLDRGDWLSLKIAEIEVFFELRLEWRKRHFENG